MKKHGLYYITSLDHFYSQDGWQDAEDVVGTEVLIETVGFFIGEDEKYLHLSQVMQTDGTYLNTFSIPKRNVTQIKEINGYEDSSLGHRDGT